MWWVTLVWDIFSTWRTTKRRNQVSVSELWRGMFGVRPHPNGRCNDEWKMGGNAGWWGGVKDGGKWSCFIFLGLGKNVKNFRVDKFFILLKPFMRMASYGGRSLTIAFENGMLRGVRGCALEGGYALRFTFFCWLLVVGCWLLVAGFVFCILWLWKISWFRDNHDISVVDLYFY